MTSLYGALSAYVQAVTLRAKAEGAEPGDLDHAFRTRTVLWRVLRLESPYR